MRFLVPVPVLAAALAVVLATALVACGDDAGSSEPDAQSDVEVADTDASAGDVAETGPDVPDAADDADLGVDAPDVSDTPDTDAADAPDTPDTDAADAPDTDDAQDAAADPDTADVIEPTPVAEDRDARCDDGEDNDLDGDIDCADTDCAGTAPCIVCDAPNVVRGGDCVAAEAAPEGSGGGTYSYVSDLKIPPMGSDAECCFDFTGDDAIDNAFAGLIETFAADTDFDAEFAHSFEADDLTMILSWGYGESGEGFHLYFATNDLDDDGEPDEPFDTRRSGSGTFQLDPASVDGFGALIQFNRASREGAVVTAGPSTMRLSVPVLLDGVPIPIDVQIEDARVSVEVSSGSTGVESVDDTFDIDGEDVLYGGFKLGGVVPLDQLGALMNGLASECTCAGFVEGPVIAYGDDGVTYGFSCVQTPSGDCTGQGSICENLEAACTLLPAVSALADVDQDGNGVDDAISVGLRMSLVGATLTDPPFPAAE